MKRSFVFAFVLMLLSACSYTTEKETIEDLKKEISMLKKQNENQIRQITELEEDIKWSVAYDIVARQIFYYIRQDQWTRVNELTHEAATIEEEFLVFDTVPSSTFWLPLRFIKNDYPIILNHFIPVDREKRHYELFYYVYTHDNEVVSKYEFAMVFIDGKLSSMYKAA
ncbi:hypothetical protein [Longirhabdus pacifica]|uniref:hypothetical protein n=1 Tax=Longirhabdus pacifica TaxID=2305227 RepID=UPI001008B537|nr:hypothetical protein [Longirhabdus pacifica]